jgi:hypothetical protein
MDSPTRRLRQQRAALVATQGDPELPIGGTLFARQARLRNELQQALAPGEGDETASPGRSRQMLAVRAPAARHARSPAAIHADMQRVHAEIRSIQDEIDRIDDLIAEAEGKTAK